MVTSRPYQSGLRRQQAARTRDAILSAARRLFVERGYAATSLADIAAGAGVSVPTLYTSVGNKAAIGFALVEYITGQAGVPELDQIQMATKTGRDLIRANAHLARTINERAGAEIRALNAAAEAEPELAAAAKEGDRYHRQAEQRIAHRLAQMGALREDVTEEHAAALLITFNAPEMHRRLSEEPGSSFDRAESWIAETLIHLLLAKETPERSGS